MAPSNPSHASVTSRRGRPTKTDSRSGWLKIRIAPDERRRLQRVAAANFQTLTEFVRSAINEAGLYSSDEPVF